MASSQPGDQYKEKFRPDADAALDREVEAALGGLSIDDLMASDAPKPAASNAAELARQGLRRGKVISVDKDDVFVDFGGKSQGIASLLQFEEPPKVGDELDFHVERYDEREGVLILNRKGGVSSNVTWENLEIGQIVEGLVTGMNKGGLELEIKSMRAFMPSGQVDIYFQKDISTFIGQRLKVEVTQFDRQAHNLIVSRRNILEREKEEARQKMLAELEEGQTRRGTVRNITDFGAFVDLGGVDGLLHVSEMSYRRGKKPADFVKLGDLVEVKVIKFDRESGKLSLSLKAAMADPWTGAEAKYAVGTAITGRVARVEPFGAFIELEEGLEGLLPVSEISWQRIRAPGDVVKEGDTIKLVVISIDPTQRRMSLSLKQAGPDPWASVAERYAVDMVVPGKITRVVDFGAFVELEPGLEGLAHISELADHRVRAASDAAKPGQEVRVRVLEIDKEHRKISLSIRKANEAAPAAAAPVVDPNAKPTKKKKRPELRGGLDWNW
jgi:small subunit ribosomal protein S1